MQYTTHINWQRHDLPFNAKSYDRTHDLVFKKDIVVTASSAPEFAGKAELPNPEELFTASISSCFMLTFLHLAAMKGLVIDTYSAEAVGTLAKNAEGKLAMTEVVIKPAIAFNGAAPDTQLVNELFKKAHDTCFISCSVKTKVTVQSEMVSAIS